MLLKRLTIEGVRYRKLQSGTCRQRTRDFDHLFETGMITLHH